MGWESSVQVGWSRCLVNWCEGRGIRHAEVGRAFELKSWKNIGGGKCKRDMSEADSRERCDCRETGNWNKLN